MKNLLRDAKAKMPSVTGNKCSFARVNQEEFERYRFKSLEELIFTLGR
ncbi:MAG: hypothetical protein MOIL_01157 [Candidatus Methanolliviera sp. GoM_oil]|nr:MAG: hypothetical protein MOIL_01157 [Candidatus Methanolliviera sp. GoM_oil]